MKRPTLVWMVLVASVLLQGLRSVGRADARRNSVFGLYNSSRAGRRHNF